MPPVPSGTQAGDGSLDGRRPTATGARGGRVRRRACRLRDSRAALQGRESLDQLGRLEGAVAPAHAGPQEDAGAHEAVYRLAGGLEGPVDEGRRGGRGEDGGSRQGIDEPARRGVAAGVAGALEPGRLLGCAPISVSRYLRSFEEESR